MRGDAAKYVQEVGLQERAVYNSINYKPNEKEIEAIRETGLKAAIIQAFNPRNPYPEGMIQILKGTPEKEGLITASLEGWNRESLDFHTSFRCAKHRFCSSRHPFSQGRIRHAN